LGSLGAFETETQKIIDFRSDTVTIPGPDMRQAIAGAPLGEDLYQEDPTVNLLESRASQLLGKQAALFVPTGTMGNLIALKMHSQPGEEVILEERSHIYNGGMAGISAICGLLPRPLRGDSRGMLRWEDVRAQIRPKVLTRSQTRMICLENTHNFAGGTILDQAEVVDLCARAKEVELSLHLDGARLPNVSISTGLNLASLASPFDSIMMSFSKGLGAPGGAILAGSMAAIKRARSIRKLLGGAIHQPGILAAGCLYGLDYMFPQLERDHANAKRLAQQLSGLPGILLDPEEVVTNIVIAKLHPSISRTSLCHQLQTLGVLVNPLEDERIRFVTHCDIDENDIDRAVELVKRTLSHTTTFSNISSGQMTSG
jgi:threonine aldolase